MWSALDNTPPPVTAQTSYALPCWELNYLSCADVTGFRSPSPDFLTGIVLKAPMMGERVFVFLKKRRGKKFSESFSPLPWTRLPCTRWRVVEIYTQIGLHVPLRRNSPGDICPRFCWSCWFFLPRHCKLSQPIAFGLVVPDVTPKITCAREHLKSVMWPKLFSSLNILQAYNQYALGLFGKVLPSRALAC